MPNAPRLNNVGTPCSCEDVHPRCCLTSCDCPCGRLVLAGPELAEVAQRARPLLALLVAGSQDVTAARLVEQIDALLLRISRPH